MVFAKGPSAAWRSTFYGVRDQFGQAGERHPDLRHVVIQALDQEQTIPPSLEAEMQAAGGWSVGELRGRWEIVGDNEVSASHLDWLKLVAPAKLGYLFGTPAARTRFEQLAERAWLALPGTRDGKTQAYPQPRLLERWMAFVYQQLESSPSSYFAAEEELWVLDFGADGKSVEKRYAPQAVKQGEMVSRGYPDSQSLSSCAQRWVCSILATDPFTVSAVAIDQLLAHASEGGPRLVSWQEMDCFLKSPAYQTANHLIDFIILANGQRFPIYRRDCKPVPGNTPSICPSAEPKPPVRLRPSGELLAELDKRFRQLHLVGDGETVHWVGRQATVETTCVCHLPGPNGAADCTNKGLVALAEPSDSKKMAAESQLHRTGNVGIATRDASQEYLIKVGNLKGLLNERARGGKPSEQEYASLRAELVAIPVIRDALPSFVLACRTLQDFWQFIKPRFAKWSERSEFLQREFARVLRLLEGGASSGDAKESAGPESRTEVGRPSMIKVLLLSANPIDAPLSIDEEFRAIDAKIRASDHRDDVQLIPHGAVRLEDIPGLLMRHKPHVVHFSGHGAATGIALTAHDGTGRIVPPDALANIFQALKDNVRVVLLNACDSAPQAEAIVSVIDCAVGMSDEIKDNAAIAFAAAFYEALGYGRSVQIAFDLALVQLDGTGADRSLAKLHKRRGVKPSDIVLVTPQRPR
jgi:hypothetical protein